MRSGASMRNTSLIPSGHWSAVRTDCRQTGWWESRLTSNLAGSCSRLGRHPLLLVLAWSLTYMGLGLPGPLAGPYVVMGPPGGELPRQPMWLSWLYASCLRSCDHPTVLKYNSWPHVIYCGFCQANLFLVSLLSSILLENLLLEGRMVCVKWRL